MKVADMSDFQEPLDWSKIVTSSKPVLAPNREGVVAKAEHVDWTDFATGSSGDIEIERGWLRVAQELFELFCKKQHDYGPANIAVGGLDGIAIRVSDKVSRLWKLQGLGSYRGKAEFPANTDESLRDTLLDLADYGIIAALVHDGVWKTMTLEEAWNDNKAD
jgi:hypothetical protein